MPGHRKTAREGVNDPLYPNWVGVRETRGLRSVLYASGPSEWLNLRVGWELCCRSCCALSGRQTLDKLCWGRDVTGARPSREQATARAVGLALFLSQRLRMLCAPGSTPQNNARATITIPSAAWSQLSAVLMGTKLAAEP